MLVTVADSGEVTIFHLMIMSFDRPTMKIAPSSAIRAVSLQTNIAHLEKIEDF